MKKGSIIVLLGVKFLYPNFDIVLMYPSVIFLYDSNLQVW